MEQNIIVWDPLIRIFHWSLVTAVTICYFTQEQYYELHLLAGYSIAALVVIRIIWGFVSTGHARFSDFVRSPAIVMRHLKQLVQGKPPHYLGHNPAGGAMIIALLLAMIVLCVSGIMLDAAENRSGPLGDTKLFRYLTPIQNTHDMVTEITVVLVFIHILGVISQSVIGRENLVRAMITGKKRSRA